MDGERLLPTPLLVLSVLITAACAVGGAGAATLSATMFTYDGGSPAFTGADGRPSALVASWNPRAQTAQATGNIVRISFFGRAPGCGSDAGDGPAGPLDPQDTIALRRQSPPLPPAAGATIWSPLADSTQCIHRSTMPGPTFIAASSGQTGLQLMTLAGPAPGASAPPFWEQRDSGGQEGSGNNQFIEGTFLNWTFDWQHGIAVHPWPTGHGGRPVMIASLQSVTAARVEDVRDGTGANQAKQQFSVSFLNPECRQAVSKPQLCQLRFMFMTDVIRRDAGGARGSNMINHGRLLLDPQQGGLPVLLGLLNEAGQPTVTAGPDPVALWRSNGAASQHGTFSARVFSAEITFDNLISAMRLVALREGSEHDDGGMAALFGPSWANASAWLIVSLNAAQEVHSASSAAANYIGGSVNALTVRAAS